MILLLILAALPGTDLAGDVGVWAAALTAMLTATGVLIGIGRWVITAPIISRVDQQWSGLDRRLVLIEDRQRLIMRQLGLGD